MNPHQKHGNDYGAKDTAPNDRPKNYADWCSATKEEWQGKPIEVVESYYINLKGYVGTLKKKENWRNNMKPVALIAKKKQWRNGLHNILCNDPLVGKEYRQQVAAKTTTTAGTSKAWEDLSDKHKVPIKKEEEEQDDLMCDEKLD